MIEHQDKVVINGIELDCMEGGSFYAKDVESGRVISRMYSANGRTQARWDDFISFVHNRLKINKPHTFIYMDQENREMVLKIYPDPDRRGYAKYIRTATTYDHEGWPELMELIFRDFLLNPQGYVKSIPIQKRHKLAGFMMVES